MKVEYAGSRVVGENLVVRLGISSTTWLKFAVVSVPLEELRERNVMRALLDAPALEPLDWDDPLPLWPM